MDSEYWEVYENIYRWRTYVVAHENYVENRRNPGNEMRLNSNSENDGKGFSVTGVELNFQAVCGVQRPSPTFLKYSNNRKKP